MSIINSESRKRVATHISKILIENIPVLLDTTENFSMQTRQKTIRQGEVAVGRVNIDDKLLIYGNDFQAAAEDSHIIDQMIQIVGVYDSTTDTWSIDETEWGALTLDDWIYYNNNFLAFIRILYCWTRFTSSIKNIWKIYWDCRLWFALALSIPHWK